MSPVSIVSDIGCQLLPLTPFQPRTDCHVDLFGIRIVSPPTSYTSYPTSIIDESTDSLAHVQLLERTPELLLLLLLSPLLGKTLFCPLPADLAVQRVIKQVVHHSLGEHI